MNNYSAKVSIIVPVYNVECYLNKCIDSLISQTYKELEIILVDDGSLDNSGKKCDEYALKDKRIKVIHQDNGGVSVARQTGLKTASGDYIIHADPDDWVEKTMCEELVRKAIDEDADLVICDYWTEEKDKTTYCSEKPSTLSSNRILEEIITGKLHGSCWNKLVKRSSIAQRGISFTPPHITVLEDTLFNCKFLHQDNIKVAYLPKAFYHYNKNNTSSLCHVAWPRKIQSEIDVLTELEKEFGENQFDNYYDRKRGIYFGAILAKRYDIIKRFAPDIKERFYQEKHPFAFHSPVSNCINIALKGHPRIAYYYYQFHISLISLKDKIKVLINLR